MIVEIMPVKQVKKRIVLGIMSILPIDLGRSIQLFTLKDLKVVHVQMNSAYLIFLALVVIQYHYG